MQKETSQPVGRRRRARRIILTLIGGFLAVSLLVLAVVPPIIMNGIVGKRVYRTVYQPQDFGVQAERLTLQTDDGLALAAWLTEAENPSATIIILSGIENPSVTAFFGYAKMFQEQGYGSLLIEMRAHNDSEGEEVALAMEEWLDVKAGVDYLRNSSHAHLPIVAMGTSMGAATVNVAAGEIPDIDGVISLSSYSSWQDVFTDTMVQMGFPRGLAGLQKPFVSLYLGLHYGFEKLGYTPLAAMEKLGERPILLMHSTGDTQVDYLSHGRLLERAEGAGAHVTTFVREGDWHFIVYDESFETPQQDQVFCAALLGFLAAHFGQ